jgi:competence protein ComEC
MINVNTTIHQGDAHLLEFPDGSRIMIDVADAGRGALEYLRARGIDRLRAVVISHAHKDHYGALEELVAAGIRFDDLYINVPPAEICDVERPWGCDLPHIEAALAACRAAGIRVRAAQPGDVIFATGAARLEVLYGFSGLDTPIGRTDVNDTSLVMRLTNGAVRALFTGDLNEPMGAWLAANGKQLEAELLKVPHHGAEGVAPNAFFARVGARAALVPAPEELWLSDRDRRVREYLAAAGTTTYVGGIQGHVVVRLGEDSFQVETERP